MHHTMACLIIRGMSEMLPERKRVFVVGDSISIQYGPHLARMLAPQFEYSRKEGDAEARLNLDNPVGANGGDSGHVRAYLTALAHAGTFRTNYFLLNCGLHDIKSDPTNRALQIPPDAYRANLLAIISLRATLCDELIWIRTTGVDEPLHANRRAGFDRFQRDIDAYNAIADEIMREHGVHAIDLSTFTASLGSGKDIFTDGVHYNDATQRAQAAFIAGWLARHAR